MSITAKRNERIAMPARWHRYIDGELGAVAIHPLADIEFSHISGSPNKVAVVTNRASSTRTVIHDFDVIEAIRRMVKAENAKPKRQVRPGDLLYSKHGWNCTVVGLQEGHVQLMGVLSYEAASYDADAFNEFEFQLAERLEPEVPSDAFMVETDEVTK